MVDNIKKYKDLFHELSEGIQHLGIELVEDKTNRKGGVCKLDDKIMVIYDKHSTWQDRVDLILDALKWINADAATLPPKIRELLEDREKIAID
jgi:hypothetical protein